MADKPNKLVAGNPDGPKKPVNSRLEQAQKMASNRKSVAPSQFFQEAWVELKKTTWPNKDTTAKSTTVVLGLVLATAIYVGVIDFVLTRLTSPLFNGR
jgi:preprotein translocase subunit SecE